MATLYSVQVTKARALAAGTGYELTSGTDTLGAKERIAFFSILTTGAVNGDTLQLATLPKGSRILGGQLISEALGTSVTLSVGTDTALAQGDSDTAIAAGAANLLAATSHASAANTSFAATYALGAGARCVNGNTTITATVGGADPTTAKQIQGWIRYVQN